MRRAALLGLLLAACRDPAAAPLSLLSVTPSQSSSSAPVALVIAGQGIEPLICTDFRQRAKSTVEASFAARLLSDADGTAVELQGVALNADKTLAATLPAGVGRGQYDLQVTDPRGASATLAQAFRVVTSAEDVADFRIDIAGDQRVQVPFAVALTAVDSQGHTVDGYDGTVSLSDLTGSVEPASAGPFVLGRAQVEVSIGALAAQDQLTVKDALGHSSSSEPFAVGPGLAVKIAFASAPVTTQAGACSAQVALEVRDAFDLPAPAPAALAVALSGGIADAVSFFSDAACASPLAELDLASGESGGAFYFLTERAGTPTLRAAPASLPSATQVETVSPAAPVKLGFASSPQALKAGDCSAPVSLQAQDVWGNPSPVPAAVAVALSATPPAGFTFHGDGACGAESSSLAIAAGESEVQFTFRAASAGDYSLDASASAPATLAAASQDESVSP